MKLTYITEDKTIGIDGDFRIVKSDISIDKKISAIQWDGNKGHIEYFDKDLYQNKKIENDDLYILDILKKAWSETIKRKEIDYVDNVYYDETIFDNVSI